MESLQAVVGILKKVVLHGYCSLNVDVGPKVRVLEPKGFNRNPNAKELENFLWDMEQFFKATRVPEVEKVSITGMYLMGDAKLWWRTQVGKDSESGSPKLLSWRC